MRRIVLVGMIVVGACALSAGQAQEPSVEKGKIEDIRGATKVYVGMGDGEFWLLRRVVKTIRRQMPQLVFVTIADDADVWFLISVEGSSQTDSAGRVVLKRTAPSSRVQATIISAQLPGHPRLAKKVSTTWQDLTEGGRKDPAAELALKFVDVYRKANSGRQAETTRVESAATAPPRLTDGRTPADAGAQTAGSPPGSTTEQVDEEDVVRVNTSLVTIHASVTGRDGKPAPALRQEDFSVYEDDVKQDLAIFEPVDRPFTVVLLIDISDSVKPRIKAIAAAANTLMNSLRDDDRLVVLTFDVETREVLKLGKVRDLRSNPMTLSPGGGTALYDAVDLVIARYLRRLPGRKAVIMLTDGIDGVFSNGPDGGSFIATAESNTRDAEELDALFYAVQYNTWVDPINNVPKGMKVEELRKLWEERSTAYLRSLTQKTGGTPVPRRQRSRPRPRICLHRSRTLPPVHSRVLPSQPAPGRRAATY